MNHDNLIRLFVLAWIVGFLYVGWAGEEPTYRKKP